MHRTAGLAVCGIAVAVAAVLSSGCGSSPAQPGPSKTGRLAYSSRSPRAGILLVNDDGTKRRRLSPTAFPDAFDLDWSPDGSQLVFTRSGVVGESGARDFIMRTDGSTERQIGDGGSPQLAPDGKSVLVVNPLQEIDVLTLDGRPSRLIGRGRVRDPAWSPDGATIAFLQDNGYPVGHDSFQVSDTVLYTIRPDGSDRQKVANSDDLCGDCDSTFGRPTWLADGKSIVVSEFGTGTTGGRLRRTDLGGGGKSTDVRDDQAIVAFDSVVFAPDGSRAAFLSGKGVEAISLNDGKRAVLVKGTLEALDHPSWSPDGKKLAYLAAGA